MSKPRTVLTFLDELHKQDKTLAQWAREKSLPLPAVYRVAKAKAPIGRWGATRQVLRAMGITPPPVSPNKQG